MQRRRRAWGAAALGLTFRLVFAGDPEAPPPVPPDLTTLSIEDLLNVEVTSVARRKETLAATAAAVYVLTQEEIHRSGATSIPEALRMVPGLEVARIDADEWAITARGFNGRFANKLLVLIDGRSVYSPLFSGVYWDEQDTALDDVERIEVIRGPGASVWGANAVNGVINIVTKDARATRGTELSAAAGREDRSILTARYGGAAGDRGSYRVYAKYLDRDRSLLPGGTPARDGWHALRGGFRGDWDLSRDDSLTVLAGWHDGVEQDSLQVPLLTPPYAQTQENEDLIRGANLMGRFRRAFSPRSDLTLQLYWNRSQHLTTSPGDPSRFGEMRDTYDFDLLHHLLAGRRQEIAWGIGYRFTHDRWANSPLIVFDPETHDEDLPSAFVQDTFGFAGDRLHLTLGSKFEVNDYTGFEIQPDARLIARIGPRQMVWGALSRAVRAPSRAERDIRFDLAAFPDGLGGVDLLTLFGSGEFRSEVVVAAQAGYRFQPGERVYLDVAAFENRYRSLQMLETGAPFPESTPSPAHTVIPEFVDNHMDGHSHGIEIASRFKIRPRLSLVAWYDWFDLQLEPTHLGMSPEAVDAEGNSPRHQAQVRLYLDLPRRFTLDGTLHYVSRLENQGVPGYLRFDLRLGYAPSQRFEASLVLQNLLQRRHPEWGSDFETTATEVERALYGSVTWRF